jgi:hypothetical protein
MRRRALRAQPNRAMIDRIPPAGRRKEARRMQDNAVTVDASAMPNRLVFAPRFNVAVPFIDRHLAEGRGDKAAIVTVDETVSYAELARRVSRCGNALLALGLRPGDRLLMVVRDSPGFIATFFGAIKAGIVPVAVNTMLRAPDYTFLIDDSECAALVWSESFDATVKQGLDAARHRPGHAMTAEVFPIAPPAPPTGWRRRQRPR